MKGGTALNLFVQDMPRLSVDIDVVFIDHVPDREAALAAIRAELRIIQQSLQDRGLDVRLRASRGRAMKASTSVGRSRPHPDNAAKWLLASQQVRQCLQSPGSTASPVPR